MAEDVGGLSVAPIPIWRSRSLKKIGVLFGLDGKMIHFGKQADVPARDLIREYLLFSDDVLDELGSRKEIKYIHTMLEQGSGADRQLKVFRETRSLKAVVDYMALETRAGLHNGERVLTSRGRRILGKEQDHLLYRSGANG